MTNEAALVQGGSSWNVRFDAPIIESSLGGLDFNNVTEPKVFDGYFNMVTNGIVISNAQNAVIFGNTFVGSSGIWGTNVLCGGSTAWRPLFMANNFGDQSGNARNFVVHSDTVVPYFICNSQGTVANADVRPADSFIYGTAGIQTRAITTTTLTNTGVAYFGAADSDGAYPLNVKADGRVEVGGRILGGVDNTAIGRWSLNSHTNGDNNTAIGFDCLSFLTNGAANTAVGYDVFWALGGGAGNAGLGSQACLSNSVGNYNTALGCEAGRNGTVSSFNTLVGGQAGYSVLSGSNNVALGYDAAFSMTTGQSNIVSVLVHVRVSAGTMIVSLRAAADSTAEIVLS